MVGLNDLNGMDQSEDDFGEPQGQPGRGEELAGSKFGEAGERLRSARGSRRPASAVSVQSSGISDEKKMKGQGDNDGEDEEEDVSDLMW